MEPEFNVATIACAHRAREGGQTIGNEEALSQVQHSSGPVCAFQRI